MELFSDNVPVPVGMAPEEWAERKRKLKRKAWRQLLKAIVVIIISTIGINGINGGYSKAQPKRLDELKVVKGTFYVGGAKRSEYGIVDAADDKKIIFKYWLGDSRETPPLWKFREHPCTVWYYMGYESYVYQLEVDGVLIFDLEQSNHRVDRHNKIKEDSNLLAYGVGALFVPGYWFKIRGRYREWLSKEA